MNRVLGFGAAGLAVSAVMLAGGYWSGRTADAASAPAPMVVAAAETAPDTERARFEAVIRDYLLTNPEVLLEAQQALESKRDEQQRVAQLSTIKEASSEIFNAGYDGIYGNPQGKYTIVEFFDYNCGYCKRAIGDMQAMTKADPDVRFVLKEFPILGPDSHRAHVVSMAFRSLMPEKYPEFHDKLLGGAGRAGEDSAIKIAVSLGADEAALREAMKDPAIEEAFAKTYELANRLGITGTPSYVVGEEVVFGALGQAVLEEKVAALRE